MENLKWGVIITHLRGTVTVKPRTKPRAHDGQNLHFRHYTKAPFKYMHWPFEKLSREGRKKKAKNKQRKE